MKLIIDFEDYFSEEIELNEGSNKINYRLVNVPTFYLFKINDNISDILEIEWIDYAKITGVGHYPFVLKNKIINKNVCSVEFSYEITLIFETYQDFDTTKITLKEINLIKIH